MMPDVLDLYPFTDQHSARILHHALAALARHRGLTSAHIDPATRLHLLVSLHEQIRSQLLDTILTAHRDDYTRTELAVLLNLME
jgi:hypothetical protein